MVGKYPTHKGDVQIKTATGYLKIGDSALWVHNDSFITGTIKFDASKVSPENGVITIGFNAKK